MNTLDQSTRPTRNNGKIWVEIMIEEPDGNDFYVGLVDRPLERSIFSVAPEDFIRLDKVRWREEASQLEFRIVKQSEMVDGYHNHIYLRKSKIVLVRPIKEGSEIWADPPIYMQDTTDREERPGRPEKNS